MRWASCSVDLLEMGVFKSEEATFASNSFYFITTNERPGPSCSKLESAIHRIISIQWISIREASCTIHWIEIYAVDSAIHLWNNSDELSRETMTSSHVISVCEKITAAMATCFLFKQRILPTRKETWDFRLSGMVKICATIKWNSLIIT